MTTSDYTDHKNIDECDKKIVDDFIDKIATGKYSNEAKILRYLATKLYRLCDTDGAAAFNTNTAVENIIGSSNTHDVMVFHEQLKFILDNAEIDKRYVCNNIRYSFVLTGSLKNIAYLHIHCNSNNAEFIIRIMNYPFHASVVVNAGNNKKSFVYCDCRDENCVLSYELSTPPFLVYGGVNFVIDGDLFKYRLALIKNLGYCLDGCYCAMNDVVNGDADPDLEDD